MAYIGIDGKAKEIKKIYVGVDGKAKEVSAVYVGGDNFTKRDLPSGYTQVEYIKSSGTQYIDTGIIPKSTVFEFEITATYLGDTSTTSEICGLLGLISSDSRVRIQVFAYVGYFYYGVNSTTSSGVRLDNKQHTIRYVGDGTTEYLYIDGKLVHSVTVYTTALSTNALSFYVFGRNRANTLEKPGDWIVNSLTMKIDGTLVRDFVPCKNASNVVGLYDMVNGVFYKNKGSGAFVSGAVHKTNTARLAWKFEVLTETVEFATAGTYSVSVPSWAQYAEITACGGGGGGSSGCTYAYYTGDGGAGGGGAAAIKNALYDVKNIAGTTLTINVGAGGKGGEAKHTIDAYGNTYYTTVAGGNGGATKIGNIVTLNGGAGGNGKTGGAAGGTGGGKGGNAGASQSDNGKNGAAGLAAGGAGGRWDTYGSQSSWVCGAGGGGGSLGAGGNAGERGVSAVAGTKGGGGGGGIYSNISGADGGGGYVKIVFKNRKS